MRSSRPAVPAADTAASFDRGSTAQQLLRQADGAMYAAKGAGKGRAVLADVPAR
jgi:predicted signal transduction protein with EAL and GGDEF domain